MHDGLSNALALSEFAPLQPTNTRGCIIFLCVSKTLRTAQMKKIRLCVIELEAATTARMVWYATAVGWYTYV